jgi:hypothetical protein
MALTQCLQTRQERGKPRPRARERARGKCEWDGRGTVRRSPRRAGGARPWQARLGAAGPSEPSARDRRPCGGQAEPSICKKGGQTIGGRLPFAISMPGRRPSLRQAGSLSHPRRRRVARDVKTLRIAGRTSPAAPRPRWQTPGAHVPVGSPRAKICTTISPTRSAEQPERRGVIPAPGRETLRQGG